MSDGREIVWSATGGQFNFTKIFVPGIGVLTLQNNQWTDSGGRIHEVIIHNGDRIVIDGMITLE